MRTELRIDPLTGQRAVIAVGDEGATLAAFDPVPAGPAGSSAPPPLAILDPASPLPEPQANRELFWSGPARGAHEAVGDPAGALAEREGEAVAAAMELWRERMRAHADAACRHLTVTEDGAGASLTRLFALDFVPAAVARERERFGAYTTQTMGGNLLGDLVQHEVRGRHRIVSIDEEAVLIAPFAARVPYQLMLVPRTPRPGFEDDGPLAAGLLHEALGRLARRFGSSPPLVLWVRTAPRGAEEFCWRIDILPRLEAPGALELGTGVAFNPVSPERAAAELREV